MKTILLLFFLTANFLAAQNIHVVYSNKTSKYTTFQEDLFIVENNSVSIRDSTVVNTFDAKANNSGNNEAIFFRKEKNHKITYFKNHKNKVLFNNHLDEKIFFIEDVLPEMNWNTNHEETKMIAGFLCNKATLKFRGSNITAFYSKILKYNSGPYKFGGLEGLILEIQDDDHPEFNSWIATIVQENYQLNHKLPNIPDNTKTISLKDFLVLKNKNSNDQFNKMIGNAPSGVVIKNKKIIRGGIEKKYEWE
ncbi:GLPGLI family protein [Chryseobacterium gotjawalense]|uniref:GLPGLI family protein n=1 Tax=Chryseobacterium gotjawalense TaxID=3042315 RepID=A0ABY8RBE2_9FLAO|nr:GLPGLI family protein [Chryseobacterium sp. wdc7]WHF51281.1 GLPGLI family protein [Chryseobacterium sp. wdc7]